MRTWCVRMVGVCVSMVCMYAAMWVYVWGTSSTWVWAPVVCVVPMVVLVVGSVVCMCGTWDASTHGSGVHGTRGR